MRVKANIHAAHGHAPPDGSYNRREQAMFHDRAWLRVCVLAAAALAAACASPERRQQESLEAAASWAATAEMVATGYAGNAAPRVFARRMVETIRQGLQSEGEQAAAAGREVGRGRSSEIAEAVAATAAEVAALSTAVEQRDRGRAAALAPRLRARAEALQALARAGR